MRDDVPIAAIHQKQVDMVLGDGEVQQAQAISLPGLIKRLQVSALIP
jgi:hypothetical protein